MKIRIPIAFKLIAMTIALLLGAVIYTTDRSSQKFEEISTNREEDANRDQALARATEVEGLLISYVDKIKVIASLLLKDYSSEEEKQRALDLSFRQDRDLVSVEVVLAEDTEKAKDQNLRVVNEDYLSHYNLDKTYIDRLRDYQDKYNRFHFGAVFAEQIEIRNSTTKGGAPLISIGVPFVKDDFGKVTHIAVAEIRLDRLQKVFSQTGERLMYLIDKEGHLLAHPKEELVFSAAKMIKVPIVKKAMESKFRQQQLRFEDEKGEKFTGSFARTSFGVTIIAQASEDVILEAARAVRRDSFLIAGKMVSVALFIVFIFSMTLTSPIEKLVEMVIQVSKGNFDVKSGVRTSDEVGQLASAVDEMVVGLKERDKVKNVLNKFHGSAITEDLLSGEIELGGSKKDVTVFFSDIRDFTKFSEGHTPEEVVEMLNEYFGVMVEIITRYDGVVDKFIGDAIMAIWGAPQSSPEDAYKCTRACIEMRQALETLNHKRLAQGKTAIKIGMGVHSGKAISGNIGSDLRMEYTVIGDTVNTASRIEASTKAFGTDLLISGETQGIVSEQFLFEEAGKVAVKGKEKPLSLIKVRGYIDENGQEVLVSTEWSDYEAGDVDKVQLVA